MIVLGCSSTKKTQRAENYNGNGLLVVLQITESNVTTDRISKLKDAISKRLDRFGIVSFKINESENHELYVELPGLRDHKIPETILKTGILEFKNEDGQTIITGVDIENVTVEIDKSSGQAEVTLVFNNLGSQKLAEATTINIGKKLLIYLDDRLLQAPVIKEPITGGKARIAGYNNEEEAQIIATLIRSGALPMKTSIKEITDGDTVWKY